MRRLFLAEFLGTAFLLAIVVGSGIMGESLAQGNVAIALLANSLATGAGLFVLIQCLRDISGAHFNPVVSLLELGVSGNRRGKLAIYWLAQMLGALLGVFMAHAMFGRAILQVASKERNHSYLWFSEVVATFGLVCVVMLCGRNRPDSAPLSVAAYITAAYWFTSSTSFANPAVTVARMLTNTFCGIAPAGVLPFVLAQVFGGALAFAVCCRYNARNEGHKI